MTDLILPASKETLRRLRAGDTVRLFGLIYTARDAAHRRLTQMIGEGKPLPFDLRGVAIYYAGPTPAPPGLAVGSCGPTTSARMDAYAPILMKEGQNVMIGKGPRSKAVIEALIQTGSVYLAATGGAGALLAQSVKRAEPVCFEDLGTEAVRRLYVEGFPAIVGIDSTGGSLFHEYGE